MYVLMVGVMSQVILGIVTLLFSVPILLGVLHQALAFFLLVIRQQMEEQLQ